MHGTHRTLEAAAALTLWVLIAQWGAFGALWRWLWPCVWGAREKATERSDGSNSSESTGRGPGSKVKLPGPRSRSGALLVPSLHASYSLPRVAPCFSCEGAVRDGIRCDRLSSGEAHNIEEEERGASHSSSVAPPDHPDHRCDGVSRVVHLTESNASRLQRMQAATARWD